jgi:adhesin transport system outer membrane protein
MRFKTKALFAATALVCAAGSYAQSNEQLKSAAQKAVSTNPEVTARFNAYRAAADAVDAARGGYYPRLDLSANVGRDRDNITSRNPETQSLSRSGASLTLTQLLWDGLATPNEVGRLGHEKMARYFELLDVTEQTTLEAARAYYDVLRFRRLVTLAEDNYVQHRGAFNQIQSRFKAGVGRGVDLEQAGARLALAESNLSTEVANLHDVSARYQRVIGEAPPAQLSLPPALKEAVPANATGASAEAIRRSAAISASVETLRAARALASVRESAYQPKVEARVRSGAGRSFDGVRDQTRDSTAEIVLNWNLFNGGSDRARVRQQANAVNQAADLRDKACRDTRQTVEIAYNDTRKLVDQLTFLDRNTLAIEKARDAYRQQFDIGQRSLLDLLNSENELYTARRSYANAEYDLGIAYARTHASMQQLSSQLGLTRADTSTEAPQEAEGWSVGDDAPGRCPAVVVEVPSINTEALAARAANLPSAATVTAPTAIAPLPAINNAPPVTSTAGGTPAYLSVRRLNDWAAAWEAKDVKRYMGFYSPNFTPSKGSVDAWKARRAAMVGKKGPISVRLEGVQTTTLSPDRVDTRFTQTYNSDDFKDVTTKVLTWQQSGNEWFIVKESDR